jgi:xyloglucan-specific exo-beta-1,4-glucanase
LHPSALALAEHVGGAYRWDEPTQSWIPLLDWNSQDQTTYQGVESIAIDPLTPSKLYILAGTSYWKGGNTAILRSSDYGNSFAVTDVTSKFKANGNGADRQKGEGLTVDPNLGSVLFCGTLLLAQTNTPGSGIGTNWFIVPNSNTTNCYFMPGSTHSSVFFRLISP